MSVINVNEDNFKNEVINSEFAVLVEFGAEWCAPCRAQYPILKNLSEKYEKVKFVKIDIDESPNLCQQYNVKSVPTLMVFKDGKMLRFKAGLCQEENLKTFLLNGLI